MQQLSNNGGPPAFLSTHPSNARRIEKLLKQLDLGNRSLNKPS